MTTYLRDIYSPRNRKQGKYAVERKCDGCCKPVRDNEAYCDGEYGYLDKYLPEGYARKSSGEYLGSILCDRATCNNKIPVDPQARAIYYDTMRAKFNPAQ